MSDSWFDRLPSHEREKIRRRMRSPEAYELLRERVKGPQDLEREMRRSEALAELHFAMESDLTTRESVRSCVREDIAEQGTDAVLESRRLSPDAEKAIAEGKFRVAIETHPKTKQDALIVITEGNVQEKLPVKPSFSEKYAGQALGGGRSSPPHS